MNIKNFLTSGFDFKKHEYEKKLHYILYNTILLFTTIMMSILAYIRVIHGEFIQLYIDLFIVATCILSLFFLRKSKKYATVVTNFLLIMFFLLVSETFLTKNASLVGSSWFIIFLLPSFFLGGRKKGIIASIASLFTIIILGQFLSKPYNLFEYFYVLMPLIMGIIFIILFEKRNLHAKKLLLDKNIALRKEIEEENEKRVKLSQQTKELANIIEKSSIELYIIDTKSYKYLYANNGSIQELGYSLEELFELNVYDVNPTLTFNHTQKLIDSIKNSDSKSINFITKHRRKDGSEYTVQAFIYEIEFNNKKAYAIYDIDITLREKAQKELLQHRDLLKHQAFHDELTGLPNRALFLDRLTQSIYQAQRNDKQFAVLFLDLDQFKQINDSLGHEMGDLVLKEVAARFKKIIRKVDTIARLGGDEFTLLIKDIKSSNDAAILAQKLLVEIQKPFFINKLKLYVTNSIGISLYPQDAKKGDMLLRNADAAMYSAKESGRNTFHFYSKEMTKNAFDRVVMEASLRHAIEEDEFIVYYQPQFDIKTDEIIGFEALVRWEHPQEGLVQPIKFIPLANENGMIVEIDKINSKKAMNQYIDWLNKGYKPGKLSLNLTIKQLMQADFIEDLNSTLNDLNFNPKWLIFEITESQIMTNPKIAIEKLLHLNNLGIDISIDDFGTGYSSLSYLKKLPIAQLKIDKSFIDEIPTDSESSEIVITVITLAKILNLQTIAEGVENLEQKSFLLEHGCENVQGYLYSKPLCTSDMTKLLSSYI